MNQPNLNVCEVHPFEEKDFREQVLNGLLARQAVWYSSVGISEGVISEVATCEAREPARDFLVNQCAQRIAVGSCSKFTAIRDGLKIRVSRKDDV